ncbi:MAG TPA: NAD(P)-dependent oxidoreductase [Pseudomonadales bacterium]
MDAARTLIFGASGYIGSHVAEQAALAGQPAVCLLRPGSDDTFLATLAVTVIRVDLADDAAVLAQIQPGDRLINCIADSRLHVSEAQRHATDVALACRLFHLAQQAGAAVFVQLGSIMAFGFGHHRQPLTEHSPCHGSYSYNRIALARETALRALHRPDATRLVLVRPATVLGRRDHACLPPLLAAHRFGLFPLVGNGRQPFSAIDARDAGRVLLQLAETAAEPVSLWLAQGYCCDWLQLKAALDQACGRRSRVLQLPAMPLHLLAGLLEWACPYAVNLPLTRFAVDVLGQPLQLDDSRLRASGFAPHYRLADSITDFVAADR